MWGLWYAVQQSICFTLYYALTQALTCALYSAPRFRLYCAPCSALYPTLSGTLYRTLLPSVCYARQFRQGASATIRQAPSARSGKFSGRPGGLTGDGLRV